MNDAIKIMLNKYHLKSYYDYENALKEIMQEIALLGLWREKFFEKAAFYGGSALRILYQLDRFSEDLDFSLLEPDSDFSIKHYLKGVENELKSFGFDTVISQKQKTMNSNIESAFIKAGTLTNLIQINVPGDLINNLYPNKIIKIKFEVDKDPPLNFTTEVKYLLNPIPFSVKVYQPEDLFAGKMHAILCREWKNRIKGRDWYDLVWYIRSNIHLNLKHLENRLIQTKHLHPEKTLTEELFFKQLHDKIKSVDFNIAKKDVINLIKDPDSLQLWSQDFFLEIVKQIKIRT
jgi:predicted nucleotidyltransferase component of viral defense system